MLSMKINRGARLKTFSFAILKRHTYYAINTPGKGIDRHRPNIGISPGNRSWSMPVAIELHGNKRMRIYEKEEALRVRVSP